MKPPHILIVEDDIGVAQGLIRGLHDAGFETSYARAGDDGLKRILSEPFDLVLLDLMLPGRSGLEVLEAVGTRVSVPVVVLSARTELPARLESFAAGAIDFVPKPFFLEELIARIQIRLGVRRTSKRRVLAVGDTEIDLDARVVRRDGVDLGLTTHETNVLTFLRERAGQALTRAQIAARALPESGERFDRTVDAHVSRIRKKLGPGAAECIRTVWGIGYRCDEESR
ncbi:MAG: response regulator transcription factor [Myxococcota bacterium]